MKATHYFFLGLCVVTACSLALVHSSAAGLVRPPPPAKQRSVSTRLASAPSASALPSVTPTRKLSDAELLALRGAEFAREPGVPGEWTARKQVAYARFAETRRREVESIQCRQATCRIVTSHASEEEAESFLNEMEMNPTLVGTRLTRYPRAEGGKQFTYFTCDPNQ